MVVPVSGSAVRAVFFPLTTPGFVPTVNGQPHRGISPPKPALWSRPQLGKNWLRLSLCVPSLTLQPLLQHLHRRCSSCRCFCLHPSCLLILIHPSVHPSSDLSVRVAFRLTCLSHLELLQVFSFLPDLLQIIKHLLERQLDYLSWLHKCSNGGRSRRSLLHGSKHLDSGFLWLWPVKTQLCHSLYIRLHLAFCCVYVHFCKYPIRHEWQKWFDLKCGAHLLPFLWMLSGEILSFHLPFVWYHNKCLMKLLLLDRFLKCKIVVSVDLA